MSDLRTAAQQALNVWDSGVLLGSELDRAMEALRAALEQEPWVKSYCGGKPNYTSPPCDIAEDGVCEALECCKRGQP